MATSEGQIAAAHERRTGGYAPIRDYALIGNKRTAALVALDGSIDWLPLPRFDSPSALGALLDSSRGGRFTLSPAEPFSAERRYLDDTNVLETEYETASGRVRVTEAMTLHDEGPLSWNELPRRVEGLAGEVPMSWRLEPRFDWGRALPEISARDGGFELRSGTDAIRLDPFDAGEPDVRAGGVEGGFTLRSGGRALLALTAFDDEPLLTSKRRDFELRLDETADHWRRWSSGSMYEGRWRDSVVRSALALELMCERQSGAMVAAPTTSLPERVGGDRNYDYRYCWLRDTTFALDAMLRLGYREQVQSTYVWLLHCTRRTHPRMRVFFTLDREPLADEQELPLEGYRRSGPVRCGNSASEQLQLGSWGDVFETTWLYLRDGNFLDPDSGTRMAETADLVCRIWESPDAGIWELHDSRNYSQSKLACWTALDRALRMVDIGAVPGDAAPQWREQRARLASYLRERCWSERLGAYARSSDSHDELDAAMLLLARSDFEDPRGERANRTYDAITRRLGAGGPLLYRFTGAEEQEGAFLPCTFWLVEALARAHRFDEAAGLMDEAVALSNDVGLLSEEVDPSSGEMLGNFPQALAHLAVINAATVFQHERERAG
ncbi:MAG: glycoside hydrolase family 15 protein [Thermoleophilaceae bacterium]